MNWLIPILWLIFMIIGGFAAWRIMDSMLTEDYKQGYYVGKVVFVSLPLYAPLRHKSIYRLFPFFLLCLASFFFLSMCTTTAESLPVRSSDSAVALSTFTPSGAFSSISLSLWLPSSSPSPSSSTRRTASTSLPSPSEWRAPSVLAWLLLWSWWSCVLCSISYSVTPTSMSRASPSPTSRTASRMATTLRSLTATCPRRSTTIRHLSIIRFLYVSDIRGWSCRCLSPSPSSPFSPCLAGWSLLSWPVWDLLASPWLWSSMKEMLKSSA